MREILFRAKRLDNGEWVEGLLWKKKYNSNKLFISCFPNEDDDEECFVVDPETVCQFTGLTDKNGVKIFEGDVLQGNGNPKDLNVVVFGELGVVNAETLEVVDNMIGWYYKPLEIDALSKLLPFCLPMPLTEYYIERCEFEVIDNIFDNPELLKEGAE